jgi:hypothetical protein
MRFLVPIVLALGCGGGGDDGGGGTVDAAVQGSCFYSCNTPLGTAYGCSSKAEITSSATCSSTAETQCGDSTVGQSEFVATCVLCGSACAPSWYMP